MIKSSRFKNISACFSKLAIFVGMWAVAALMATPAIAQQNGQTTPAAAATAPVPAQIAATSANTPNTGAAPTVASAPSDKSNQTANAANDYKSSLNSLSALYQNEVKRLEGKHNQSKELYDQGLISRKDLESSDQALADARAKIDQVAKQIAEANKPAPTNVMTALDVGAGNHVWTTGNVRIDGLINLYGQQYSVDPYLIFCLMSQESKFGAAATSPKGAQGLMQLMPGTAARYGVTNPYDVAQNIKGGTRYLKDLLTMFNGRVDLALAGYNAGENAVIKHGYSVPPYDETRNYVKLIIARYGRKQVS